MHTLVLGFDAFDPQVFQRLWDQGRLPHLGRYAEAGGYAPFAVSDPPQSEVSWTSIATGLNPAGHGIFDFVHRDPASYGLVVSLLPTRRGLAGTQFVPPFQAHTLFDEAARQGYPATALWWPATFPARPESPVRTLPGLGTPDIQGRLGVGTLFSSDPEPPPAVIKTGFAALTRRGADAYWGRLTGPLRKARGGSEQAAVELDLELDVAGSGVPRARLALGDSRVELVEGTWSPILELRFKLGLFVSVRAITRAVLTRTSPDVRLYFLPLQLHPLHSPWRYATPRGFVKRAWQAAGPFLTLGWQQDTTALEEGCIDDNQFLALCDSILARRERLLLHQLDEFDEGVLASVFDSLDRVQHMFWHSRSDVVEAWYEKLDGLLGRVEARLQQKGGPQPQILVVSDHGFADFEWKAHLNRWLIGGGYLAAAKDQGSDGLKGVDWPRSRAYAVGLNSLYVNLAGREGQGSVSPGEYEALVEELRRELLAWQAPDGEPVVRRVQRRDEAFAGPHVEYAPDLVVGYAPGRRASAETGLGQWAAEELEPNRDHWGADHCMAAEAVPGVLFSSRGLAGLTAPSYRDFPRLAVGMEPREGKAPPPPQALSQEESDLVEERLRGLGYL